MLYLNKLLYCIKKHPNLFTLSNVCFVTGLIKNQLTVLRQFATSNGLICAADKRKHYILTELGEKYSSMDEIIEKRRIARSEKNWDIADKIRIALDKAGIILKDSKDGTVWELKG